MRPGAPPVAWAGVGAGGTKESGGRCEYAGIGDTHNDLRFAAQYVVW
jgi:hypothetical protein